MRRGIIVLLLLVAVESPAFSQTGGGQSNRVGKAEQAVLKLLDNWMDALKGNDVAALERILADDFMIVGSDGSIRSKDQELAPIKSGDIKFESFTVEGVKVHVYGDTAVVTGVGTYKVTFKGRTASARERFFDVYQKRKGRWQVIASRQTEGEKVPG